MDTWADYVNLLTDLARLNSAIALLTWDEETHMPKNGLSLRAETIGKLSRMAFELLTGEKLGRCLEALERREDLSERQAASVRVVGKEHRRNRAIPADLFEEYTVAQSKSQAAWADAKRASDFELFRPHLERMVGYVRRFASLYGYEESAYDALLDRYEPGMTQRALRQIIEPLRAELVPLADRLLASGAASAREESVFVGEFPIDVQRRIARAVLERIGYDFASGALDDTMHPFTTQIAPGDVRITNRYLASAPLSGLFGALHEGGHALYDQGMGEELYLLQLGNGSSYGVHESQSRLMENQIGRSRPFWGFLAPVLAEAFPALRGVSVDAMYTAANRVARSLIRVEADEVTYNLHIMLRFEIESGLFDGSLQVPDLPEAWNDAMSRYLGVVPGTDAEGVLQDIHWSTGLFGYFPSYMLGNLYAAQIAQTLRADLPSLDRQVGAGEFRPMLDWLRDKVHRFGAIHEPEQLIRRITGTAPSSAPFLAYIRDKYGALYGV